MSCIVNSQGGLDTSDATASASKILNGYTAYVNGSKVTGSALATTTTAGASRILDGYTAYNDSGTLITGNYTPPTAVSSLRSGELWCLGVMMAGFIHVSLGTNARESVIFGGSYSQYMDFRTVSKINVTNNDSYNVRFYLRAATASEVSALINGGSTVDISIPTGISEGYIVISPASSGGHVYLNINSFTTKDGKVHTKSDWNY